MSGCNLPHKTNSENTVYCFSLIRIILFDPVYVFGETRMLLKNLTVSLGLLLSTSIVTGIATAKPVKNKYGVTKNGHMPEEVRQDLSQEVVKAQQNMTQEHYEDIVRNPYEARNDQERLASLSAREVIILVDRSGSMNAPDENPTGKHSQGWTRWDSAKVAAQSISELAVSLDSDNNVDIMLWDGDYGQLRSVTGSMTQVGDIDRFFEQNKPQRGTTPLAEALTEIYNVKLRGLLDRSEPFTVIVLTDGQPDNSQKVKQFFKDTIRNHRLEDSGRETLAAFSFVRMGDDAGAIQFLEDLDDNLISQLHVNVDIVDTKEDNFLFGTGKYKNAQAVGPFALFWDAIYD